MKKSKALIIGILFVIFIFGVLLLLGRQQYTFTVIPDDAVVVLDGKTLNHGSTYRVSGGKHSLILNREGFATLNTTFVGDHSGSQLFTLIPASTTGFDWLQAHPSEELQREAAGGESFDVASQKLSTDNGLVQELPFVLQELRIDYGMVNGKLVIYVTAGTPADRREAIQLIQGFGYDPSDYTVIFKTPTGEIR